MSLPKVGSDELSELLEQASGPVAADLWMEDCPPCKLMSPKVERVAEEHEDRIEVVQVPVEEGDELLDRFEVEVIPTLLFFRGEEVTGRIEGVVPASTLRAAFEETIAESG